VTEQEWLGSTAPHTPYHMLSFLRQRGVARRRSGRRKFRLLACALCRLGWPLLTEEERRAVEAAERSVDGPAPLPEIVTPKPGSGGDYLRWSAAQAAAAMALPNAAEAARQALGFAPNALARDRLTPWVVDQRRRAECEACQRDLLQDLFGNPFRPVSLDPAWLAWHGGAIPTLAGAVYEVRELPSGHLDAARLAVLADMLEEAGCTDADLLGHLRGPGPHVRGCFAVDLVLGRG
jgi:hypothetical protein